MRIRVPRSRLILVGLTAASVAGALLFMRKPPRDVPRAKSANEATAPSIDVTRTSGAPAVAPKKKSAPRSAAQPSPDAIAALRRGLGDGDEATRIAAVEAAVSATAIETLPDLERFDLKADPETAPTVIHAVAILGASAEGAPRDEAAATLTRWLDTERKRDGADAIGNVSNLVEALGEVGGSGAVDTLVANLDRADMPLHLEALAVEQLGELHDPRARGAVERFAGRVGALPPTEGLDEELRTEAIATAKDTLAKL